MFTTVCLLPLSWVTWIQLISHKPISSRSVLILLSQWCWCLPNGPFPLSFLLYFLYTSHISQRCYFANPSNPHQSDHLNNTGLTIQIWCSPYNYTNVQYSVYLTPWTEYFSVVVISSEKLTYNFHTKYEVCRRAKYSWSNYVFIKSENSFHSVSTLEMSAVV
jgi:hypothetical protein